MTWTAVSPSGEVSITISNAAADGGHPTYSVVRRGVDVVHGVLGLVLDSTALTGPLPVVDHDERSVTSSFSLPHGKTRTATADADEITVRFQNPEGDVLEVVARAYDDGVAFRYQARINDFGVVGTTERTMHSLPSYIRRPGKPDIAGIAPPHAA